MLDGYRQSILLMIFKMKLITQGDIDAAEYVIWVTEGSRKDVFVVKDEAVSMRDSLEVDATAAVIPPPKKKVLLLRLSVYHYNFILIVFPIFKAKVEKAPMKRQRSTDDDEFEPEIKIVKEEIKKTKEEPKVCEYRSNEGSAISGVSHHPVTSLSLS